MDRILCALLLIGILVACQSPMPEQAQADDPVTRSLAYQSWEDTEQPVGSAAYLGLGTYAKCLCTAVFASGRTAEEFATNSDGIVLEEEYVPHVKYQIDEEQRTATAILGDSVQRVATYLGDQGCILDIDKGLHFEPVEVVSSLPPADSQPWPMGDMPGTVPEEYDPALLSRAAELAFDPRAITAAFLVIHRGDIIIERYREELNKDTQLESWSMGKSLTATLIGRLLHAGKLTLEQRAPVEEWQQEGDPRGEITIRDLLQMSSGLRFPSYGRTRDSSVAGSGSYDRELPLAQLTHIYPYTGSINVFDFAVNRPLGFAPGSRGSGQYRNSDPLALGYIIRNLVEAEGGNYWTWPQEILFDRIGIRRQLLETDRWGNFIMTGYDYGTARNWGRLGLLYLQDGVWQGERLLPEGYVKFVSSPAPGWEEPIYGGQFWLNTQGIYASLPTDAFAMRGGGGQNTIIVPSLELVIVRLGHSKGSDYVTESLNQALEVVVQAVSEVGG